MKATVNYITNPHEQHRHSRTRSNAATTGMVFVCAPSVYSSDMVYESHPHVYNTTIPQTSAPTALGPVPAGLTAVRDPLD